MRSSSVRASSSRSCQRLRQIHKLLGGNCTQTDMQDLCSIKLPVERTAGCLTILAAACAAKLALWRS